MGMKKNGSSYFVELNQIKKVLAAEDQSKLEKILDEGFDQDLINNLLATALPESFPMYSNVYCFQDEDTIGKDMEYGEVYVMFDEEDLFTKVNTPECHNMMEAGIEPKFSKFSIWE